MKKYLIIILIIFFVSCSTSVDCGKSIHTDFVDFTYLKNYNEFVYKSKINAVADNEVYYTTNFSLNLPKNIKGWLISDNEFYFEYANKQIVYIYSGYKNEGVAGKWTIQETNDDEIYSKLSSYWDKRKYNENNLKTGHTGRVSKFLSDGKVTILLYNIKRENFDKYLDLAKSFKYLD
ncbi:hypothetical protein J2X31_003711 [Flavobacterium arsenatis]|uniref:DUF4367 domain-containing protein n=1 Tax=Flavobacterium arsenatis TaxID=1484332 RepID=A0ABU1TV33_9FLAO|nr:hypothetical protein [Flavobacterium arsenatis]MDR6969677.1 hypothetical protein [Flavobacterium arsenatis]